MSRIAPSPPVPNDGRRDREIESYRPYLLNVARQSLHVSKIDCETSSDFVQDALLAATVADRRGRGPGPSDLDLRLWLRAILQNKIRAAMRRKQLPHVPVTPHVPATGTSPSQGAIKNEELARLEEALCSLAKQDRQLVLWSVKERLTRQQIGDLLGVSATYASRICQRAEVRLRDAYRATRRDESGSC